MILIADVEFPEPDDQENYCELDTDGNMRHGTLVEGYTWCRRDDARTARIIPKAGAWILVERGNLVASGSTLHTVDAKRILTWLETGVLS